MLMKSLWRTNAYNTCLLQPEELKFLAKCNFNGGGKHQNAYFNTELQKLLTDL